MCVNNAWMAKIHQIGAKSQKSILWPKLSFLNPQNGHKYYKNPLGAIPISFFHIIVLKSSLHLETKSQPKNMHNVF